MLRLSISHRLPRVAAVAFTMAMLGPGCDSSPAAPSGASADAGGSSSASSRGGSTSSSTSGGGSGSSSGAPGVDASGSSAVDDGAAPDVGSADSGVLDAAAPPEADAPSSEGSPPDTGEGGPDSSETGTDAGRADGSTTIPHTGRWQIMPLGDSITGNTCYPQLLSKELIDKNHTNFTFIGTNLNNQSCGSGAPNLQTEGHGGYLITYLTTDNPPTSGKGTLTQLKTWAAEKPEVVLLQMGTNDVWNNIATSTILSAYSFVLDQFRSQNPNVIFFVAQILPMHPSGCGGCEAGVEALNSAIPGWAAGKTSATSPIHVVNVWASIPEADYTPGSMYTSDGVHPNVVGAQLAADAWYAGLQAQGIP